MANITILRRLLMPICGFNPKMLKGLTLFAQGLYEQAKKRSEEDGVDLKESYDKEIEEMNIFLSELDRRYYEELRPKFGVEEGIKKLFE
ncbi:MAG: hypothetical protein V1804_04800 [Patescibacteria group bacterium]